MRKACYSGGHGIHSPFAFDFVSNVVYNPCPYYFFDTPSQIRHNPTRIFSPATERKIGELLFRIVDRYRLANLLTTGEEYPALIRYAVAPSSTIKLYGIESVKTEAKVSENNIFLHPLLILFNDKTTKERRMELYHKIKPLLNEETVIAIPALHSDPEKRQLWSELCNDPLVRVTFDLYDLGILFFRKNLHKRNYTVYF